jgi:hypothetical protein
MSAEATTHKPAGPVLDLSKWGKAPLLLVAGGVVLAALAGLKTDARSFGYSYLMAYMFFLSLSLGALFLVMIHHLFDAGWSVPIRRICEHLACLLFPVMAILWIPIGIFAPKIYPWMSMARPDHALHAKEALLNKPVWYGISIGLFLIWGVLTRGLRYWSLQQDQSGAAKCTHKMRFYAAWGIFAFAITLTLAAILWVKTIEHEWFSTMYGVYFFAESVWTILPTVYVITLLLKRAGPLSQVATERQFLDIGVLWLAFTVFYAYIHFAQYFIIWNANVPEETFWYVQREKGSWWSYGMLIIFGHFFLPFLALLRIDAKLSLPLMIPLAVWAWLMHFCDIAFNVIPPLLPTGFGERPAMLASVVGCLGVIGGVLALVWHKYVKGHPAFPQKDPRMLEALGLHHPTASDISVAHYEGRA